MARRAWERRGLGAGGYLLLAALAGLSPMTNVFILPALPELARGLDTSLSAAQFALSAGLAGLAVGQLVVGPMSDRLGRRTPLTVGLFLYVGTTVLCAFATDITVLIVCRLLQGASGGAAWVIARAMVRDIYSARASARVFSQMAMITGLAPIIAPILGGQLLAVVDWRGLFAVLACIGVAVTVMALIFMRETLPRERRQQGGLRGQGQSMLALLRSPYFMAFFALSVVQSAMYFTFLIMSPFVFQGQFGLTVQAFGALYACAAVAIVLGNQINVFLLRRWTPMTLLCAQLLIAALGAVAFLVAIMLDAPLPVVLLMLLPVPLSAGATNANITALALAPYGHAAGTAAALLGACQFGGGALVPPLVSLLGVDGVAMGLTLLVTGVASFAIGAVMRVRLRAALTEAFASEDEEKSRPLRDD